MRSHFPRLSTCEDTSVSGLWTPSGGDPTGSRAGSTGGGGGNGDDRRPDRGPVGAAAEPSADEVAALQELHARLRSTPVEDMIANHALGIWQLALVHLGVATPPDERGRAPEPNLPAAGLAIDALAALVDGLGTRLGESEGVLRDALGQAQMIFVEIADALAAEDPDGD
jgi:hypothetical protein